jgi:hypothetical protein
MSVSFSCTFNNVFRYKFEEIDQICLPYPTIYSVPPPYPTIYSVPPPPLPDHILGAPPLTGRYTRCPPLPDDILGAPLTRRYTRCLHVPRFPCSPRPDMDWRAHYWHDWWPLKHKVRDLGQYSTPVANPQEPASLCELYEPLGSIRRERENPEIHRTQTRKH